MNRLLRAAALSCLALLLLGDMPRWGYAKSLARSRAFTNFARTSADTRVVAAKDHPSRESEPQKSVLQVGAKPNLGVDYSQVLKFKIGSRRTAYRRGELISLDLAMVNVSANPVFVHRLLAPSVTIKAVNEQDQDVRLNTYATVLEGIVPDSYTILKPGDLLVGSILVLAGCKSDELSLFENKQRELDELQRQDLLKYQKAVFELSLFVNWGDGCLDVPGSGTYTITVEQANDHVVSSRKQRFKTAVGTIRSTPLVVTLS